MPFLDPLCMIQPIQDFVSIKQDCCTKASKDTKKLLNTFGDNEVVELLFPTIISVVLFLVYATYITKLRTHINLCVGF